MRDNRGPVYGSKWLSLSPIGRTKILMFEEYGHAQTMNGYGTKWPVTGTTVIPIVIITKSSE